MERELTKHDNKIANGAKFIEFNVLDDDQIRSRAKLIALAVYLNINPREIKGKSPSFYVSRKEYRIYDDEEIRYLGGYRKVFFRKTPINNPSFGKRYYIREYEE